MFKTFISIQPSVPCSVTPCMAAPVSEAMRGDITGPLFRNAPTSLDIKWACPSATLLCLHTNPRQVTWGDISNSTLTTVSCCGLTKRHRHLTTAFKNTSSHLPPLWIKPIWFFTLFFSLNLLFLWSFRSCNSQVTPEPERTESFKVKDEILQALEPIA